MAAQSIDEIDNRRPLVLEHVLDLLRLAIERVIPIDYAQFRQDRDHELTAVRLHIVREFRERPPRCLEPRAVFVVKRSVVLPPIRP